MVMSMDATISVKTLNVHVQIRKRLEICATHVSLVPTGTLLWAVPRVTNVPPLAVIPAAILVSTLFVLFYIGAVQDVHFCRIDVP